MTRFAVYQLQRSGRFVVDVQSDLMDDLPTRAAIPLLPIKEAPRLRLSTLNPMVVFADSDMVLMTEQIVSIPLKQLVTPLGSPISHRDEVIRAIDMLLGGV